MSAALYGSVNGVNRKAKKLYANVGGVNRELKELWAKEGGVNRKIFSGLEAKATGSYRVTGDAWYIKKLKHDSGSLDLIVCAQAEYKGYDGSRSSFCFTGSEGTVTIVFDLSETAQCVQRNVKLKLDTPINFVTYANGSDFGIGPRYIQAEVQFRSTDDYWLPILATQEYGNTLNPPFLTLSAPDGYLDAAVYYFALCFRFGFNSIDITSPGNIQTYEVGFHVVIPSGALSIITGPDGLDEFPLNFT